MDERESVKQRPRRRRCICPTCKRSIDAPTPGISALWKYYPFCSERCKWIDLGAWLDAEYRFPARADEDLDDLTPDDSSDIAS